MEKHETIRLLVIEDNATLVVAGLRSFFRPGRDQIEVSEVTTNVGEAIEKMENHLFDVIILDLIIPGTSPADNIRSLKEKFPTKPVIIYSSLDSKVWRRRMWNLGASGYVHKNDGRDILKNAILAAFSGKTIYSEDIKAGLDTSDTMPEFQHYTLSIVEKEMLSMLTDGMKYKEISGALHLKTESIEATVKQLRKKFRAKSTPQLIFILTEQGLL